MLDSATSVQVYWTFVREGRQPLPEVAATARSTLPGAFAFDLDGTVYLQGRPLPGALELLAGLDAARIPFLFVTNNSSTTGAGYVNKLRGMGLDIDRDQVLTSNDVTIAHLQGAGITRPWILGNGDVRAEYAAAGIRHEAADPDAVLLTFDQGIDYARITTAARLITGGLPYLATHPDVNCPVLDGFLPDVGSFIELFAASTGRRPEILGKPQPAMARAIAERLGKPATDIAFVGDRLQTDVHMANRAGFRAVLTLTGVTGRADLGFGGPQPDFVVEDMTELAARIAAGSLAPVPGVA